MYCRLYKAPITSCTQNIILNHVAYLGDVEELPTDFIRQFCYGDRRDNARSGKIVHPILVPSFSNDTFSLMVSLLSVPSSSDNSFCHIFSPYQRLLIRLKSCAMLKGRRSKVKDNSCQKKRILIINYNIT